MTWKCNREHEFIEIKQSIRDNKQDLEKKIEDESKRRHWLTTKIQNDYLKIDEWIHKIIDRQVDNEKNNLAKHLNIENTSKNIKSDVTEIKAEIWTFKKILWSWLIALLTSIWTLIFMLLQYIYKLITNNG